ncbi:MAG: uracil-DNA glycosylase [Hyphomicrobiaceae bacterium]|nr:MAG: uracil-DNA glycosylase [Hyphomicrobiaceae bacterium]
MGDEVKHQTDGEPPLDCALCPRLAAFRRDNRQAEPNWHNAPVPSFGDRAARLLIVGLAPGLKGANRTGRPFTGDYAGDLLYHTLLKCGLASGVYHASPEDGLALRATMVTNAVRCVPPANKPTPAEIKTCQRFLLARIRAMPQLRAILALGRIAHDSALGALELRRAAYPFGHGQAHSIRPDLMLFDSYHCSRYNTSTGVLTTAMFEAVVAAIAEHLRSAGGWPILR